MLHDDEHASPGNGPRRVLLGPEHPYVAGGLAMDAPSVGFGQNNLFEYQCRAFLDEVAGARGRPVADPLPPCAGLDEGVHNMALLDAVIRSAEADGAAVHL